MASPGRRQVWQARCVFRTRGFVTSRGTRALHNARARAGGASWTPGCSSPSPGRCCCTLATWWCSTGEPQRRQQARGPHKQLLLVMLRWTMFGTAGGAWRGFCCAAWLQRFVVERHMRSADCVGG